ncbi:hypothetical protein [Nocardia fluminea]|uniref:Uncharacterized protein n=1 Tax=Nocardia fluminea TaxID=134984 RepID=A0A2N3WW37_9NOCA|nr:hypothetical protein [Nocardia fluminea]PKV98070.1 hypothetical protein ATK86_0077 [Nocardia fluminea]
MSPHTEPAITTTRHAAQAVEPTLPERASDSGRQMAEVTARAPAVPVVAIAVLAGVAVWLIVRRRR